MGQNVSLALERRQAARDIPAMDPERDAMTVSSDMAQAPPVGPTFDHSAWTAVLERHARAAAPAAAPAAARHRA